MFEEFNSFFASLNVKSNPLKLGKIEGIEFELNTKKVFCTITGVGKAMSSYTLGAITGHFLKRSSNFILSLSPGINTCIK